MNRDLTAAPPRPGTARGRIVRRAGTAASLLLLVSTAACTGHHDAKSGASSASQTPYVTSSGLPYTTPSAGTALGSTGEPIPTKIPESAHVGTVPAITADQLLVTEDHGGQTLGIHVIDPKTGRTVSTVDSASVNFWAVDFGIVGTHAGLPSILAAEDWRPRGTRGKADHVLTSYSGDLLNPSEIKLPDDTRLHAQNESAALTSDGRFFVAWDDAVFGLRVVDLKTKKATGALRAVGCGPFTWVVGHDVYSPCIDSGKIIKIHISDTGVPKVTETKSVFGKDFIGSRDAGWSPATKTAVMITPEGTTYRIDLSDGIPDTTIDSIGTLKLAKGETPGAPVLSPDGKHFAVEISKKVDEQSVVQRVEVYDTATFTKAFTIDPAKVGAVSGIVYGTTGTSLYVLSSKEGAMGSVWTVTGFDPASGKKTSSATLTTTMAAVGGLANLAAPIEIGGS
ncbi:hypothetical protein ACIRU8_29350 [Streptomyces sp. NPDC101175]|uniref:hypothetical protein n=1 Tax=Streptomyces sp. NPDC101175 TaxID=3366123 RepID=UPI0038332643